MLFLKTQNLKGPNLMVTVTQWLLWCDLTWHLPIKCIVYQKRHNVCAVSWNQNDSISENTGMITYRKNVEAEFFKSKQTRSDERVTNRDSVCFTTVPLASTANPDKIQSQTVACPVARQAVATCSPPPRSHTTESEGHCWSECYRDSYFLHNQHIAVIALFYAIAGLLCWLLLISLRLSQVCECVHRSAHPACFCVSKIFISWVLTHDNDVDLDLRQFVDWMFLLFATVSSVHRLGLLCVNFSVGP